MFENQYQYDAGREYGGILERFTTALVDLEEARQEIKELRREIKNYKDLKELKPALPFIIKKMEDGKIAAENEVERLKSETEILRRTLEERDTCLNINNYQIDELKGKIATLRAEKQNLIDDNSSLASRVEQLHSEIDQLHSEIEHLRSLRRAKVIVPSKQDPLSSLRSVYADKQVGECFDFGRYPQGPNGEIKPITWRVLRRDTDSLLVISVMGLDAKPYNEECKSITWFDCTLRHWLNDEFYKKAFNKQEQFLIKKTMLENNAGSLTEDNIFLLSMAEAQELFDSDDDRCCKPTEYAVKNGAWQYNGNEIAYKENVWWWLRSRGFDDSGAASVYYDGYIYYRGNNVHVYDGTIRPALQFAI